MRSLLSSFQHLQPMDSTLFADKKGYDEKKNKKQKENGILNMNEL